MNRRMALALALLSGGFIPARLLAQDPDLPRGGTGPTATPKRRKTAPAKPAKGADDIPGADDVDTPPADDAAPPADVRPEPGHTKQIWNISRYTALAATSLNPHPEARIIDWIFRSPGTGSAEWHGEKLSILSASRTQIVAYQSAKVLKKVDQVVRRFTKPAGNTNVLNIRVRFVRAADTRWRYLSHTRMTSMGSGPQGQRIWNMTPTDAQALLVQMKDFNGFEIIEDQKHKVINGQNFSLDRMAAANYAARAERDGAAGLGYAPAYEQLEEGVWLTISPLLTYDGDAIDLALDLKTNIIRRLIKTSILTRREVGPGDMAIDVPEVTETRINQPITGWELGKTLLISAGITPGIFEPKNGFFGLPGTKPSDRELLVFLDAEAVSDSGRSARSRD